ncbi:MAG: tetratricopeptide repeat protein [Thermoanaerobaculales bacterium]|nr:tetratricopeptide repeat protein [Thermoanaerobaculales bacterium]
MKSATFPKAPRRTLVLISLLLVAATLGLYSQVMTFDFVGYDDNLMVVDNANVKAGLTARGSAWAFGLSNRGGTYWHPLTWLSHMLDCELYGVRPGPHHVTNLLLHTANTLLLFLVFSAMTGSPWRSALVAAFFALHPVNVESVAWVASRKNLLSTLFLLLTLAAYVAYSARPNIRRYLVVFTTFVVGLLAKPMLVTIPFILLLLDFWPLRRMETSLRTEDQPPDNPTPVRRLIWEKIPLLAISMGSILISTWTLPTDAAGLSGQGMSLQLRLANALVSCVKYIGKLIAPHDLSIFYPYPTAVGATKVIGAFVLLGVITVFAFSGRRERPYFAMGWLWFLVTFGPVSGLMQAGVWPEMADRWAYVPFIGLFLILSWGMPETASRLRRPTILPVTAACLLLMAFALSTTLQLRHWRNGGTLFAHAIEIEPANVVALTGLADFRLHEGKNREALSLYTQALELQPGYTMAHNGMGVAYVRLGRPADAMEHFRISMPSDRSGFAVLNLAILLSDSGRTEEATELFAQALESRPNSAAAHLGLGATLARQARYDEAIFHFKEAVRLDPTNIDAQEKLGRCLQRTENPN